MTDKKKDVCSDSEHEEEEIDIEEKETDEVEVDKSNHKHVDDKTETTGDGVTDCVRHKSSEQNGFSSFHHRLTDTFLKRKFPDFHESDSDGSDEKDYSRKHFSTEDDYSHRLRKEQLFPMDASLKTLNKSGLGVNSITNKNTHSSSTVQSSSCDDRLKVSGSRESATTSSRTSVSRETENKDEPRIHLHKPSFLITDILSSDNNRKERETVHSVFTDPRLFAVSRNFLDRPLPTGQCGVPDRHNTGVQRFADDSDYDDDDKSEGDGKYKTTIIHIPHC